MNVTVEMINASQDQSIPSAADFQLWANTALAQLSQNMPSNITSVDIAIKVVDEEESAQLNSRYRGKQGPTNVLSFTSSLPRMPKKLVPRESKEIAQDLQTEEHVDALFLGDLANCAPVGSAEAKQQQKDSKAHWAHMVIHGTLHLKGYDHNSHKEAKEMEEFEIAAMQKLGFSDPYISTLPPLKNGIEKNYHE